MFTISQFKTKLTPKLHGTTLNRIADLLGTIGEAAFNVQSKVDLYETIRSSTIQNAIYDKIYNYTAPIIESKKVFIGLRNFIVWIAAPVLTVYALFKYLTG